MEKDMMEMRLELGGLKKDILYIKEGTEKLNSNIDRVLWIIGGGFIMAAVAWVIKGGLAQ